MSKGRAFLTDNELTSSAPLASASEAVPVGKTIENYTDEDETNPDYKTTDVIISIILKEENKAFDVRKYEHTYPHSWRTDKPVLYYPLDAWFKRALECAATMTRVGLMVIRAPSRDPTNVDVSP